MSDRNSHQRVLIVSAVCFTVSVAWSALAIWHGHAINEPVPIYVLYQSIVGFIAGIVAPREICGAWCATFLGQGIVFVAVGGLTSSSTAAIGLVLMPLFCIPTVVGGAIGGFCAELCARLLARSQDSEGQP